MKSLKKMIGLANTGTVIATTQLTAAAGPKGIVVGYDQTPLGSLANPNFFKGVFCRELYTTNSAALVIEFDGELSESFLSELTVEIANTPTTFVVGVDSAYEVSGGYTSWTWLVSNIITSGDVTCKG